MTYENLRRIAAALQTLDDIGRSIFRSYSINVGSELRYPFGGDNRRSLDDHQQGLVLRAMYDDAVATLTELKVLPE